MASTFNRLRDASATCFDVLWSTIASAPFTSVVGVGFPSELRRDYDFPAKRSECFAYQLFVDERAVYLGGIEERDASVHSGVQQRNHLLLVFGRPVGPAHSHAAEAESRNFKIAFSQFALLHFAPLRVRPISSVPSPRASVRSDLWTSRAVGFQRIRRRVEDLCR